MATIPTDDDRAAVAPRRADADDATVVAELLRAFNTEYDDIVPELETLTARLRELMVADTVVLLIGEPALGVAVVRFRPSLWTPAKEAYLAELYVVPGERGRGLGRALLTEVLAVARAEGADYIELNTSETDTAARALYESTGFVCSETGPGGPPTYYYEREL